MEDITFEQFIGLLVIDPEMHLVGYTTINNVKTEVRTKAQTIKDWANTKSTNSANLSNNETYAITIDYSDHELSLVQNGTLNFQQMNKDGFEAFVLIKTLHPSGSLVTLTNCRVADENNAQQVQIQIPAGSYLELSAKKYPNEGVIVHYKIFAL